MKHRGANILADVSAWDPHQISKDKLEQIEREMCVALVEIREDPFKYWMLQRKLWPDRLTGWFNAVFQMAWLCAARSVSPPIANSMLAGRMLIVRPTWLFQHRGERHYWRLAAPSDLDNHMMNTASIVALPAAPEAPLATSSPVPAVLGADVAMAASAVALAATPAVPRAIATVAPAALGANWAAAASVVAQTTAPAAPLATAWPALPAPGTNWARDPPPPPPHPPPPPPPPPALSWATPPLRPAAPVANLATAVSAVAQATAAAPCPIWATAYDGSMLTVPPPPPPLLPPNFRMPDGVVASPLTSKLPGVKVHVRKSQKR
jgi:hypothetical protein